MKQALLQAGGAIACVAAATVLAALHILTGSDALALISATLGYFIHASGTLMPSNNQSIPKVTTTSTAPGGSIS